MKPRQPVGVRPATSRCQFQPGDRFSGKNEKSMRVSTSSPYGKGFFVARRGFWSFAGGRKGSAGVIPATGSIMEKHSGYMRALRCRECGREYPLTATHVCEFDFGPLEVVYDYDRVRQSLTRETIGSRPKSMWRYRELLPVVGDPTVGSQSGFTPLIKADRLAKKLGVRE